MPTWTLVGGADGSSEEFAGWSCLSQGDFEVDLTDTESNSSGSPSAKLAAALSYKNSVRHQTPVAGIVSGSCGDGGGGTGGRAALPVVTVDARLAVRTASLYDLAPELETVADLQDEQDILPFDFDDHKPQSPSSLRNRAKTLLVAALAQGAPPWKPTRKSQTPQQSLDSEGYVIGLVSSLAATEATPLAGVQTFAEYRRRLHGLPRALLVERQLRLCMGEVDRRQDEKDIRRDDLIVNGVPISGSKGGYELALAALAGGLRAIAAPGEAWPHGAKERAAQLLLSVVGRTSSGYATLEEALRLYGSPEAVLLAPESAAAGPLEVMVLRDAVIGRAHTRYSVLRADADCDPVATIDGVFTFCVSSSSLRSLVSGTGRQGSWPAEKVAAMVLLRRS